MPYQQFITPVLLKRMLAEYEGFHQEHTV